MPAVKLKVHVLAMTPHAVSLVYAACRQCYSAKFAGDIFQEDNSPQKQEEFIRKVVSSGHDSPLEHVQFTFAVAGVSRALTHQLVRHRIASYSQQSQRYVKATAFNYIIPPSIEADDDVKKKFMEAMDFIQAQYDVLLKEFARQGVSGEKANQDARFLLPQAAETKIVVTMNCRELLHFFQLRCCARAQWEIRGLAQEMLAICRQKLPAVFADAGAACRKLGYCPEAEGFSCGRYPTKKKNSDMQEQPKS